MRFFKSYVRFKLVKSADSLDAFLDSFALEKKEALQAVLAEIVALSSEQIDIDLMKKVLIDKIDNLRIDMSMQNLEAIYISLANKAIKKIKQAKGSIKKSSDIEFVFDAVDEEAIKAMRDSFYWVEMEYNRRVQDELKDIIEEHLRGDISLDDVPAVLKKRFEHIVNAHESYFKGVADHIVLQSENIARVTQGQKFSVQHYKILSVMDNRTSAICRSMHGRIIDAGHLENQADLIISAKSMADKKAAAAWRNEAFNAKKLPENFGLPPYHFRCRTEAVPVWLDENEIDGVKMQNTSPLRDDEVVKHIDKIGVERVLTKERWEHVLSRAGNHPTEKSEVIKALNSITDIATHKNDLSRTVTISQNGYFMVFEGNKILTIYKPTGGAKYFKNNIKAGTKEVIKWQLLGL